jgi:hypothetical protein
VRTIVVERTVMRVTDEIVDIFLPDVADRMMFLQVLLSLEYRSDISNFSLTELSYQTIDNLSKASKSGTIIMSKYPTTKISLQLQRKPVTFRRVTRTTTAGVTKATLSVLIRISSASTNEASKG